jgi:ataxia telangiectasia mutated family protein
MLNTVVKGAASTTVEELRVAQLRLLVHDYHRLPASHRLQPWTTAAACAEKVQSEARHVIPADLSSAVCAMISAVLWSHGNTSMSIETIRDVVELSKGSLKDQEDRARSNLDLGLRMASARLQAPQEILDNILTPAILEVEDLKSDRAGQMFNEYASFCYEQLTSTTISEDSERLYELCETQQKELNTLTSAVEQASAHMRGALQVKLKNVKVLFAQDQEELARLEKTRDQYLIQSLRFYLQSFGATDRHDDSIGRCCSLWFANSNKEDVNTAWATMWAKVPSHKYLQIVHQLLSRLTQDDTIFQRNLQQLLLWLAQDHPFHVLYPIYAIGSAHKKDSGTIARRAAALRLLQNIKARSSHLKALVTQTNACCAIYVKLARAESSRQASRFDWKDVPYGRDFIATMSKIDLPPLTQRIEPRASCDYTDLPRIAGFGPHVTIANGNSRPKILVCKLDDGTKNRELLKSGDDLRQDAVMQQVFLGVYAILQRNEDTRRRKLLIRTYHVLPLGDKVGVIQFVPGTKSFNDILPDLHNRYRSEDWDSKSCREKMKEAAERSRSHRYEAFNQIMERVKPVMRHIFVEWHASADRWFATQLAYTRSTAAMSILGWIIGLGDRHLSNIMLDQGTGDIVHIDLGICFEAGRLLKIPELVPFRLTRDVVDGMGIQGVEGVFKRCCTFTMAVLRKEQDSIKSILDILRYDPLYDWSVSSDKQKKQESAGSAIEETNGHTRGKPNKDQQTANWALLVVHQKLSKTLSATAMTNDLIQQATDPKRLAVIFCGWQPYY